MGNDNLKKTTVRSEDDFQPAKPSKLMTAEERNVHQNDEIIRLLGNIDKLNRAILAQLKKKKL